MITDPYTSPEGITSTVYNSDCLAYMKTLPDKYFSLAVCDPPYSIGIDGQRASTSKHGGRKAYEFKGWDSAPPPPEYFEQLKRISENQIIWGANYFPENLTKSMGWIFWDKGQRICSSDSELAYTSFDRALRVVTINRCMISSYGGAMHPTQKPVALYDWIFKNYAKPNDTIFDSHLGSQSSRIAAHKAGLSFVGTETDREYFEKGNKRFQNHVAQLTIF